MKIRGVLIAAAITIFPGLTFSQMMKPVFGPELEKLSFIVGHFTTQTAVMFGGTTSNDSGTINAHWGLDSMFVFYSATEKNETFGSYKSFGVLGYDSQNQQYILSMYNNFGGHPEYRGTFAGDTLTMTGEEETPQGKFNQQLKWYKDGENVRFLFFADFGQGYTQLIDQTATPTVESEKEEPNK